MNWKLIGIVLWCSLGMYLVVGTFAFDVVPGWYIALHCFIALIFIGTADKVVKSLE